jgi:hypothetical protein
VPRAGRLGVGAIMLASVLPGSFEWLSAYGIGFVLLGVDGALYLVGYIRNEGDAP